MYYEWALFPNTLHRHLLYFTKKDTHPQCAKSYLIWAIAGFVLSLLANYLVEM